MQGGAAYATGPGPGGHSYGHAPTGPGDYSSGGSWALLGSPKVPPYWGPELDRTYPFKVCVQDLQIWAQSTDLEENKLGAAIAGRLGGVARALAREMPIDVLRDGSTAGGVTQNGMEMLVRALARRFGPLAFETAFTSMTEYFGIPPRTGRDH